MNMDYEPGKEVRDIKFSRPKREKKDPRPVERFAPRGIPVAPGPRAPRFKLALIFVVSALALVAIGTFVVRRFPPSAKNAPVADTEKTGGILDQIKDQFAAYAGLKDISSGALDLLGTADAARKEIPGFLSGQQTSLVYLLSTMRDELRALDRAAGSVSGNDTSKQVPFFGNFFSFTTHLTRGEEAIGGVIDLLQEPQPHHLIILLGNTSELRPGGGFIGSFADVTVASGTIQEIAVRDVNEVDRTRDNKVVPPSPLQAIAARWRVADSNWFFDYPASARKTLSFMQESDMYATTTIDGVIAVTPKVFEDILSVTGPLKLSDGRVVTSESIVTDIQKDVQSGQAEGDPLPKAILSDLAPALRARLTDLSDEDQKRLLQMFLQWIKDKDAMLYMKEARLSRTLGAYNADGALYPLSDDLSGDYLAAVNANIGGNKTDLVIDEGVELTSQIDVSGLVRDTVSVTRTHHGDTRPEWWYSADNWNYLSIFTPQGAVLEDATGIGQRFITPKANYRSGGFTRDPDIVAMENTLVTSESGKLQDFTESGRNVFATWQKIPAGGSKETTFTYSRRLPAAPKDGMKYDLIYERQAGAKIYFKAKLTAPVGFKWAENNSAIYEYADANPPGRVIVSLTLKKI